MFSPRRRKKRSEESLRGKGALNSARTRLLTPCLRLQILDFVKMGVVDAGMAIGGDSHDIDETRAEGEVGGGVRMARVDCLREGFVDSNQRDHDFGLLLDQALRCLTIQRTVSGNLMECRPR